MAEIDLASGADFNGILWGHAWGFGVPTSSLTFSFPTTINDYNTGTTTRYEQIVGFQAFGGVAQQSVLNILDNIESFADLTFSLINGPANLMFGIANQIHYQAGDSQGLHRPGNSDGGAEAVPPDPYRFNFWQWGHSWYHSGQNFNGDPGSFVYTTRFMHEIGHTLGLAHGHDPLVFQHADGSFTKPVLPSAFNSHAYSVMTYLHYAGDTLDGANNTFAEHPQTFMQLDIAALQYIYGANYEFRNGNTTHSWTATGDYLINGTSQGYEPNEPFIYMTVWDGGGVDTYDLSNFTSQMTINLAPGAHSIISNDLLAILNNDGTQTAIGSIFNARLHNNDPRSLIENAIGGSNSDVITGNQANNVLSGNGGADTLNGGIGNDTLNGGAGLDTLIGGAHSDIYQLFDLTGTAYDTVVEVVGGGVDTIFVLQLDGGAVVNSYTLAANVERGAIGNVFDDFTLIGNSLDNELYDDVGWNTLVGGAGHDLLNGGGGLNTLIGGTGDDRYQLYNYDIVIEAAGEGTDFVIFQAFVDEFGNPEYFVPANVENAELTGNVNFDLIGNNLDNRLFGNAFGNTLRGNDGDDKLSGFVGYDVLIGGRGDDAYYLEDIVPENDLFPARYDATVEEAGGGTDTVYVLSNDYPFDPSDYYVLENNIENGTITGSLFMTLDGNSLSNVLKGNSAANELYGLENNDQLYGGLGADFLSGGNGFDYVRYDEANYGNLRISLVASNTNTGTAAAGDWYSTIEGVIAGAGDDVVYGNEVFNIIDGKNGNDTLFGGLSGDSLRGGEGIDYARYDDANYGHLVLSLANPTQNSGLGAAGDLYNGIEGFISGVGNDRIGGNGFINYLYGGGGNDTIAGNDGNDTLSGGAGLDTFVFNTPLNAATNRDRIMDFVAADDTIQIDRSVFANVLPLGTLAANRFHVGAAAADANDRFIYNKSTGALFFDADGTGTAFAQIQFATLTTMPTLTNADFVIIA